MNRWVCVFSLLIATMGKLIIIEPQSLATYFVA
jgi:hypothetical protein